MPVKNRNIILIADKNPHVRKFIQREFINEGYDVKQAVNGKDLLDKIYSRELIDLLIVDPDLPYSDKPILFEKINNRIPVIPIVIHAHSEYSDMKEGIYATAFFSTNAVAYIPSFISEYSLCA
jgi:DNA-binding NtrC family response regulator